MKFQIVAASAAFFVASVSALPVPYDGGVDVIPDAEVEAARGLEITDKPYDAEVLAARDVVGRDDSTWDSEEQDDSSWGVGPQGDSTWDAEEEGEDADDAGIQARDVEDDQFVPALLEDTEGGNPDDSNAPIEEEDEDEEEGDATIVKARDVEDVFDANLLEDIENPAEGNAPIAEDDDEDNSTVEARDAEDHEVLFEEEDTAEETVEAREYVEPSYSPWDAEEDGVEARDVDASVDEEGFF